MLNPGKGPSPAKVGDGALLKGLTPHLMVHLSRFRVTSRSSHQAKVRRFKSGGTANLLTRDRANFQPTRVIDLRPEWAGWGSVKSLLLLTRRLHLELYTRLTRMRKAYERLTTPHQPGVRRTALPRGRNRKAATPTYRDIRLSRTRDKRALAPLLRLRQELRNRSNGSKMACRMVCRPLTSRKPTNPRLQDPRDKARHLRLLCLKAGLRTWTITAGSTITSICLLSRRSGSFPKVPRH